MTIDKILTNAGEITEVVTELEWMQTEVFPIIEAIQEQMPDEYWEMNDTDPSWTIEIELGEEAAWLVSKLIERQQECEKH